MGIMAAAFCIMFISAFFSFIPSLKAHPTYFFVIVTCGMLTNFGWAWLARITTDNHKLVIYGLVWDVIMTLIYGLVPIFLLDLEVKNTLYLGLLFIIIGMILIKQ